ncbi:hypothetical protein N7533_007304 [Penicillium manginii]|jgi:hypothetical protein|uniref:uncharacterized protein n=1 Tax=Penicillium manginii TaxID=203109 RepID=UPI00254763DA|nr:uncharacterized protein N7533_007304 [Penicillium manginii]KAJ5750276.1 hypothetical protein N7533_007304 [Penicillium manginii]
MRDDVGRQWDPSRARDLSADASTGAWGSKISLAVPGSALVPKQICPTLSLYRPNRSCQVRPTRHLGDTNMPVLFEVWGRDETLRESGHGSEV